MFREKIHCLWKIILISEDNMKKNLNYKLLVSIFIVVCILSVSALSVFAAPSHLSYTKTLKYGSTGTLVKALQVRLQYFGLDIGASSPDGDFGAKTRSAVKAVQKYSSNKASEVDGIVGPNTIQYINDLIDTLSNYESTNNSYAAYYTRQLLKTYQSKY
jgi:peptidoglycan hydrolase-like protein with peptidoglycan-binding domain